MPPSHSPRGCGRPLALNPASFWHKFGEQMLSVFPAKKSRAALVLVSGAVAMPKAGCRSAGSLSLPVGAGAGWKAVGRTAHRGARSQDLSQRAPWAMLGTATAPRFWSPGCTTGH